MEINKNKYPEKLLGFPIKITDKVKIKGEIILGNLNEYIVPILTIIIKKNNNKKNDQ